MSNQYEEDPLRFRDNLGRHVLVGSLATLGLIATTVGVDHVVNDGQGRDYFLSLRPDGGQVAEAQPFVVETAQPSAEPSVAPEATGPLIVLDPGHGGTESVERIDEETGLRDGDYPNYPEVYEVYGMAVEVQEQLEEAGYEVMLTKDSATDSAFLRERADVAEQSDAELFVSIHTDHTMPETFQAIFTQHVGGYRGDGPVVTYTNAEVAARSQEAAQHFEVAREAAEGGDVKVMINSFDGRAPIEPGNIPMLGLFADKVPLVYNELGARDGLTPARAEQYVTGLVNGVKAAVPINAEVASTPAAEEEVTTD